jgi:rare lipoprotein A
VTFLSVVAGTAVRRGPPRWCTATASHATALSGILLTVAGSPALAKTPGQSYCFHAVCHRVLTLEETKRTIGTTQTVIASFYDHPKRDPGNPSLATSSGERFDPSSDRTAASPIYPNGTRLLLWNARTRAAAEVRVTNSGPYHGARRLDVSRGVAERLGFRPLGVSRLSVTVLSAPTPQEAHYVKGRTYLPVRGYLGQFESATLAQAAIAGGSADRNPDRGPVVTAGPAARPVHTGSVGWDTTVQPVRSPLPRPSFQGKAPAAAVAIPAGPLGGPATSPVTSGWSTTLADKPALPTPPPSTPRPSVIPGIDSLSLRSGGFSR